MPHDRELVGWSAKQAEETKSLLAILNEAVRIAELPAEAIKEDMNMPWEPRIAPESEPISPEMELDQLLAQHPEGLVISWETRAKGDHGRNGRRPLLEDQANESAPASG